MRSMPELLIEMGKQVRRDHGSAKSRRANMERLLREENIVDPVEAGLVAELRAKERIRKAQTPLQNEIRAMLGMGPMEKEP